MGQCCGKSKGATARPVPQNAPVYLPQSNEGFMMGAGMPGMTGVPSMGMSIEGTGMPVMPMAPLYSSMSQAQPVALPYSSFQALPYMPTGMEAFPGYAAPYGVVQGPQGIF